MATGMARSSGRVDALEGFARGEFRHEVSGVAYRVDRQRGEAFFEFDLPGVHGRRKLEYFIGSGAAGRSYMFPVDGFFYEAPVSYYTSAARWGISPGYEQYDHLFLTRPVRPACLQCHASRLQPVMGTQNGYASPPFLEGGIGCERCHGPGERHVRGERDIINPRKLAPDLRDSICAQCHLTGEVRVVRAGHDHPFQAGERFSDHEVAFVRPSGAAEMKVTNHFEKLALSACKQASGEKLWCGTCHDPHGARVDIAARCASCHQNRRCDRGEDCVSCHMPKSRVRDVEHTVYTDHSISHRLPAAKGNALVPFGGAQASEREWGLAYASVAGFERRARPLLETAVRQRPDDVAVLVQLAYLYDRSSQEEKAIPLYERALRLDPSQETAAVNLASAWAKRGRADDAMRLWRKASARNPGLEVVRINIAGAQFRAGDRKGARETLVKLLELNPGNTRARRLLAEW